MEGCMQKDLGLFQQYEANHLCRWYGLLLSFFHLLQDVSEFSGYLGKGSIQLPFIFHALTLCMYFFLASQYVQVHGICPKAQQFQCPYFCWYIHTIFFYTISFNVCAHQQLSKCTPKNSSAYYGYYSISFLSFSVLAIYLYLTTNLSLKQPIKLSFFAHQQ